MKKTNTHFYNIYSTVILIYSFTPIVLLFSINSNNYNTYLNYILAKQ